MATATRETIIANPGRRNGGRRNMARKMSAKQLRYFGTPRQKAAAKASRKRKANSTHRPRTKARKVAKRSNPTHRRTAKRRRTVNKPARRRNLGALYALTANPAKRRK